MTLQFPSPATGIPSRQGEVLQDKEPRLGLGKRQSQGQNKPAHLHGDIRNIQFGQASGPLSAFSSAVDLLQNPALELAFTDLLGMSIPRSYIEYEKRGWDSARENAIREITGMMFNVFVGGWIAYGATKLLANHVGTLNPLGVNHRAWIDRSALDAFAQLYRNVLSRPDVKTPAQAEKAFSEEVLKRLQSSDAKVGRKLVEHSLGQALKDDPTLSKAIGRSLAQDGRLSPEALEELLKALLDSQHNVDILGRLAGQNTPSELTLSERLRLSQSLFSKQNDKRFLASVDELAKRGGLTDRVHLLGDGGEILLKDRSRSGTLRQIRYFQHEVLNRAHHRLASGSEWKREAQARLFQENPKTGSFWAKYLPQGEEGLIRYLQKSKNLLTFMPLALTIISGISVAFINNHITKKRHGGKVFSPIEEGLRDKMRASNSGKGVMA